MRPRHYGPNLQMKTSGHRAVCLDVRKVCFEPGALSEASLLPRLLASGLGGGGGSWWGRWGRAVVRLRDKALGGWRVASPLPLFPQASALGWAGTSPACLPSQQMFKHPHKVDNSKAEEIGN